MGAAPSGTPPSSQGPERGSGQGFLLPLPGNDMRHFCSISSAKIGHVAQLGRVGSKWRVWRAGCFCPRISARGGGSDNSWSRLPAWAPRPMSEKRKGHFSAEQLLHLPSEQLSFLSGGVEFRLFENVGFPPTFSSFLPTLKTWEEKRSASSSQQSGPGFRGWRGAISQLAKKWSRNSPGPGGVGR